MEVIIFGGSGFIGQHAAQFLEEKGYTVWVASRKGRRVPFGRIKEYDPENIQSLLEEMRQEYAVINLAGQSINSGRWTPERKRQILSSRVDLTVNIAKAIKQVKHKPQVMINASAIGFYGYSHSNVFTEQDSRGEGFLADVTSSWEDAASSLNGVTRLVILRFGVVLERDGGALPRMTVPYQWYVGGKVGTGTQAVSWIHMQDVCGIIKYCMENPTIEGPINVTAPSPVSMDEFGREIGEVLRRPHFIPVPAFVLQVLLGEMSEIVLKGQKVIPKKLLQNGYSFEFEHLQDALRNLLKQKG